MQATGWMGLSGGRVRDEDGRVPHQDRPPAARPGRGEWSPHRYRLGRWGLFSLIGFGSLLAATAPAQSMWVGVSAQVDGAVWHTNAWGVPRAWIPDAHARLRDNPARKATVGAWLDHPALFAAYPQLVELRLDVGDIRPQTGRYYPRKAGGPLIVLPREPRDDRALATLLHELQHAIQDIEGDMHGNDPAASSAGVTAPRALIEAEAYQTGNRWWEAQFRAGRLGRSHPYFLPVTGWTRWPEGSPDDRPPQADLPVLPVNAFQRAGMP